MGLYRHCDFLFTFDLFPTQGLLARKGEWHKDYSKERENGTRTTFKKGSMAQGLLSRKRAWHKDYIKEREHGTKITLKKGSMAQGLL